MSQLAMHDGFWRAMCRYDILSLSDAMDANGHAFHNVRTFCDTMQRKYAYGDAEPHLRGFLSLHYAVVLQLTRHKGFGDDRIADGHAHTQNGLHTQDIDSFSVCRAS
jgi:hypothetical protein